MGRPVETVYLLTGPPADVWMNVAITSGALALFLVGLPLIQRSIKDHVTDMSRRAVWVLTALPGGILLMLAIFDLKTAFLDYPRTIAAYRERQYQVVAGCLDGFAPSPAIGHSPDTIRLGGRSFSYADFFITGPGFHQTEAYGGPIHPDSWVRLFLVGNSIVRVDAAQKACPPAPRIDERA